MNIADIFYIVAIVCMVTVTVMLVFVGYIVVRFVQSISLVREQLLYRISNFKIARFSLQLSALKMAMKLFRSFQKAKGGEER